MPTLIGSDRSFDAGIPSQWTQDFGVTPEGLISGEYPLRFVEDMTVAYNQTLAAYTVVGLDANGDIVQATRKVVAAVAASGALTLSGNGVAAETITIGSTVYTLRATMATTANEILIGATAADTAANIVAAINGAAGAGTLYGSATVPNTQVTARLDSAQVVGIVSDNPGTADNTLATTETMTNGAFGAATLTGGRAHVGARPCGVLMYPTTTPGSGTKKVGRVLRSGCLNPDMLVWHSSFNTAELKLEAFRGAQTPTNIVMRGKASYTPVLP